MDDQTKQLREKPSLFVRNVIGEEPFDYQADFMDNSSKRKVFRAGRQVGKSRVAAWIGLHHALTHADVDVLITADAQRQSSELFAQVKKEISNSGLSDELVGLTRDTNTIMEFENGSRIICLPTGRDGSKIRNYTADLIIVDEAAFIEDTIYEDVLEPMTFVTDGTMILCSTPWGQSGYFYDKATHPDWHEQHVSSYDNPAITEDKIDSFKDGKSHATIQQEVYGEFVPEAGTFFPPDVVKSCMGTEGEGPVRLEGEKIYLGCDLADEGVADTALVMMDNKGNVFSIEHHQNMSLTQAKQRIRDLNSNYKFDKIIVDSTGLGTGPVEDLEGSLGTRVEGFKFTLPSKQDAYQTLKVDMEQGNIVINDSGESGRETKSQFMNITSNKTRSGKISIHASEGNDDIIDALVLANLRADVSGNRSHGGLGAKKPRMMGSLRDV